MVYLLFLATVVAFVGFLPQRYGLQQKNYKNYIIICGVLITLMSALRSPYTGTMDSYRYKYYYEALRNFDSFREYYDLYLSDYDLLSSEAGFYFTMWLFGRVFESGQTIIIVSSVLITVAACFFIYRNSVDVPLSLTIYICLGLFTFNLNGMRQAMAMSICLFAYEFAKNKKVIPFVLLVLLAMLYHKTALCFFPMFFLPRLKNNLGSWAFYILGLVLCLLFVDKIIAGYYELSGEDYSENAAAEGGGLFVVLLYLGTITLSLYKAYIVRRDNARIALLATLAGFTAYLARYIGSDILERVSYYYFYFPILLIPEVFQELDDEEYKTIKIFFVIGAVLLFAYRVWTGGLRTFRLYFI